MNRYPPTITDVKRRADAWIGASACVVLLMFVYDLVEMFSR